MLSRRVTHHKLIYFFANTPFNFDLLANERKTRRLSRHVARLERQDLDDRSYLLQLAPSTNSIVTVLLVVS